MRLVMYDSIDVSQFAGLAMDAAAGYVDGRWQTFPTLGRHVPPGTKLVSISVFGNPADCIDVESGDVNNSQGAAWARRRIDGGHWRPIVYTSASNATAMFNALRAAGVQRNQIRFWSAHYTNRHICSPSVCGFPQADGTQWTDRAHGRNLDQSELESNFFQTTAQRRRVQEPAMQVTFGPNGAAGIAVPSPGVTHVRLACSQGTRVRVDWVGRAPTQTFDLGYGRRADVRIVSGAAEFVLRNDGDVRNPVSLAWIWS